MLFYPTQTTLVLSSILTPKKWRWITLWFAVGSALGGVILGWAIQRFGVQVLEQFFPNVMSSEGWKQFEGHVQSYGVWALFAIASIPAPVRTAVAVCAVAGGALFEILLALFTARIVAFGYTTYFVGRSPGILKKIPGLKKSFTRIEALQKRKEKGVLV